MLSLAHQSLISASAILPEVAAERGYHTVDSTRELKDLGFADYQCRAPALLMPVHNVLGDVPTYQIRPDNPRIDPEKKKPIKYETRAGDRLAIDCPPRCLKMLRDPRVDLIITEGIRKADAGASAGLCCVDLLGVYGFRGTNEYGGVSALPDWEQIALKGRKVFISFDSDVMVKAHVRAALIRLKGFLQLRAAIVLLIYLPAGAEGDKVGLDDFLACGNSKESLLALAREDVAEDPESQPSKAGPYIVTELGISLEKEAKNNQTIVPLTNFDARILATVKRDDGLEVTQNLEVAVTLKDQKSVVTVPSADFAKMSWVLERVGPQAVIFAGASIKDHARVAIQRLSSRIRERVIYTHTGWRQHNREWFYLHAHGALGKDGTNNDVEVELPDSLARFALPDPPEKEELIECIRKSLDLLEIGPARVTAPVVCAIWRSLVGACDFGLHVFGSSGVFKSELAALAQQHFGASLDARHLPASWSSTANALEAVCFIAKDAIVVIDDFVPLGSVSDRQRQSRDADRLFRAQGNNAGRGRLRSDLTLRASRTPRGLILSTGEDIPSGQSLRSRLLGIEVVARDIESAALTTCQRAASDGCYARATSGYLRWLAARFDAVRAGFPNRVREYRSRAGLVGKHARTPGIIADLFAGFDCFIEFALEVQALSLKLAEQLRGRVWDSLVEAGSAQASFQASQHPALRFIQLICSAIGSGRAHLAAVSGELPESPAAWGWEHARDEWRPKGARVGWIQCDSVFLDPDASFKVAQEIASDTSGLSVTPETLRKRLSENGLLISTDQVRQTLTIRKVLEGRRREVLHISAEALGADSTISTPDAQAARPQRPKF